MKQDQLALKKAIESGDTDLSTYFIITSVSSHTNILASPFGFIAYQTYKESRRTLDS